MLYVPPQLALFLAAAPRRHHDLYNEIKRLVADGESGVEAAHVELVKAWCVAASYQFNTTSGANTSILKLKATPILSELEEFVDWKNKRVDLFLGKVETETVATPSTNAGTLDVAAYTNFTQTLLENQRITTTQMFNQQAQLYTQNQQQAGGIATTGGTLSGLKPIEGAELATILTYCNTTDKKKVPPIWTLIRSSASLMTKRQAINKGMEDWSQSRGNRNINKVRFIEKQVIDTCRSLDLGCGEVKASHGMIDKGLTAQAVLPVTMGYIQEQKRLERADDMTIANRTLAEQLQLTIKDKRAPPTSLQALQKSTHSFAALTSVMLGEENDLYKKVEQMGDTLEDEACHVQELAYTPLKCMQYWYTLLDSTRRYFYKPLTEAELKRVGGPQFPMCTLNSTFFSAILNATPFYIASFPTQWSIFEQERQWGQHNKDRFGSGKPAAVGNPTNNVGGGHPSQQRGGDRGGEGARGIGAGTRQTLEHLHPKVKQEWKDFHEKFGGDISFNKLLKESGNLRIEDLPYLTRHIVDQGGKKMNMLCYKGILGVCNWDTCRNMRAHPSKSELSNEFIEELNNKLKKGREYMVQHGAGKRKR